MLAFPLWEFSSQETSIFRAEIFSGVAQPIDRTPEIVGRPSDKICALEKSAKTKYREFPIQMEISGPLGIFLGCEIGPINLLNGLTV